jgi:hypothetical protein
MVKKKFEKRNQILFLPLILNLNRIYCSFIRFASNRNDLNKQFFDLWLFAFESYRLIHIKRFEVNLNGTE